MDAIDRICIEQEVRKVALEIAGTYGKEGAEYFHSLFLPLALEIAGEEDY